MYRKKNKEIVVWNGKENEKKKNQKGQFMKKKKKKTKRLSREWIKKRVRLFVWKTVYPMNTLNEECIKVWTHIIWWKFENKIALYMIVCTWSLSWV